MADKAKKRKNFLKENLTEIIHEYLAFKLHEVCNWLAHFFLQGEKIG